MSFNKTSEGKVPGFDFQSSNYSIAKVLYSQGKHVHFKSSMKLFLSDLLRKNTGKNPQL